VIDELDDTPRIEAEAVIAAALRKVGPDEPGAL